MASARTAGVDDAALAEAVYVAFAFNTVNRVADALGFEHRSDSELGETPASCVSTGTGCRASLLALEGLRPDRQAHPSPQRRTVTASVGNLYWFRANFDDSSGHSAPRMGT